MLRQYQQVEPKTEGQTSNFSRESVLSEAIGLTSTSTVRSALIEELPSVRSRYEW